MTHPIPDDALDSDIAIIARKGSGKSYLARGLAERLLDLRRRLLVIDPLGAWWGLRSSADGQSAGYPVAVFGGEHADMPLTSTMGEPLAKLIAGENLPVVIDTSLMRKEEQGQLAVDLFEALFRFNKDALTIILEEADVFAPQNPAKDGYAARVLHEVDRIARRGRARGLRLISLTQRPARLHKDVLSQAATLVAMRLSAPQDRDAIKAWVEGNADRDQSREVIDSLASLPVGSGWVWAPDIDLLTKAKFPPIKTLDTSATPKAGEMRIEPKTLAEVDASAIREALDAAEPSNEGANLKRTSATDLSAAEERGYRRGIADEHQRGVAAMRALMDWMVARIGDFGAEVQSQFGEVLAGAPEPRTAPPAAPATQAAPEPRKAVQRVPVARREASSGPTPGHSKAGGALLAAIARYPNGISWTDAAIVAGMQSGNGYFYGGKKFLLTEGLVEERGDVVIAGTLAGDPATLAEIVGTWSAKLRKPGDQMLEVVAAMVAISHADLSDSIGVKTGNGYWYGGIKAMRAAGLTIDDKTGVRLSPLLAAARKA